MIDTHCHIDLYPDPLSIARECERLNIITIGMTNLPSHFELGYPHLRTFKQVRLALGMHPLHSDLHEKEFPSFIKNLDNTSYVGEIGLDFSKEAVSSREIQLKSFERILNLLKDKRKIVSLHSRKAEAVVLEMLINAGIQNAIFHWYTGPLSLIDNIAGAGYYFSVNPAMVVSNSGKEIIGRIPRERILTESDGPFVIVNRKMAHPSDVKIVYNYLAKIWNTSISESESQVKSNFSRLISKLKG